MIGQMFASSSDTRSLSPATELVGKGVYYSLIAVSLMILLAPIVIVVGIAFNSTQQEAFPPEGISLRWFAEFFFQSPVFFASFFFVSLPIALAAGTLATVLGIPAAYVLERRQLPAENLVQSYLLGPLIVPAVITGLGLMLIFARLDIEFTFVNVILGHTVITLPYTVLTAITSLRNMDPQIEEAARNLGATRLQVFYKIVLPVIRSGAIAGFLFAFIISFSDIYIALFLAGGDAVTVPLAIFMFLRWESSPIIAAISTLQILLIMAVIAIIGRLVGFQAFTNRGA